MLNTQTPLGFVTPANYYDFNISTALKTDTFASWDKNRKSFNTIFLYQISIQQPLYLSCYISLAVGLDNW